MNKTFLISKWSTHTSNGCISKGIYLNENNEKVLVKGNILGWYQPISEVISYKIAKLCGTETVEYKIAESNIYPEIKVEDFKYVSICKLLPYNITSLYKFCTSQNHFKGITSDDFLNFYIKNAKDYKCNDLFRMFFIDALVGNTDRHLNNINIFIDNDNRLKLATPFDFGESLLVGKMNPIINEDVESKPFKKYHKEQLEYIKNITKSNKVQLPFENNSIFKQEIEKEISPILDLLEDNKRKELIIEFLNFRIDNIVNEYVEYNKNEVNWS